MNYNINANKVRANMKKNVNSCRDPRTDEVNHTLLAEMAASDLNLYDDNSDIPEKIFEIATEFN